jgi:hypothetical protein
MDKLIQDMLDDIVTSLPLNQMRFDSSSKC